MLLHFQCHQRAPGCTPPQATAPGASAAPASAICRRVISTSRPNVPLRLLSLLVRFAARPSRACGHTHAATPGGSPPGTALSAFSCTSLPLRRPSHSVEAASTIVRKATERQAEVRVASPAAPTSRTFRGEADARPPLRRIGVVGVFGTAVVLRQGLEQIAQHDELQFLVSLAREAGQLRAGATDRQPALLEPQRRQAVCAAKVSLQGATQVLAVLDHLVRVGKSARGTRVVRCFHAHKHARSPCRGPRPPPSVYRMWRK